jgi:Flp pilus assembly protein TadG
MKRRKADMSHFRTTSALISNCARHFGNAKEGSTAVSAAVAIPVVAAFIAGGISYSSGLATRSNMQNAIDAAVLAGATELQGGNPIAMANRSFAGIIGATARSGASDIQARFRVEDSVVYGEASGVAHIAMGGLVGLGSFDLGVRSAATLGTINVCVLGLNSFDKGSFEITGNPSFNADCAVQSNSGNKTGMIQEGKAPVKARKFAITGGQKTQNFSPVPTEGAPTVPDPYASLSFPWYSVCAGNEKTLEIKATTELTPGTYCGGIAISGGNVRMAPGVYVMVGGSFSVSSGAVVTGDEVMIGFTGGDSTLRIWGNSSLTLTSPVSSAWKNMQFMVDPASVSAKKTWVSIGGSSGNPDGTPKLTYDGVAYFGSQNFWVYGNAVIDANSPTVAIVADKVWVQGSAILDITSKNPRRLDVANGPALMTGVRLLR